MKRSFTRTLLFSVTALTMLFSYNANAQNCNIKANANRYTICAGDTTSLFVSLGCDSAMVDTMTYDANLNGGTGVVLSDDQIGGPYPIGFNFNFFCEEYDEFYISSNGFITFSAGQDPGKNPTTVGNFTSPNNYIAPAWIDLNPNAGGQVNYLLTGTYPNRQLVVNWVGVPHSQYTWQTATIQIKLNEHSNTIEYHTTNHAIQRPATMGIENKDGSYGLVYNNRNNINFSAANEGVVFTPYYQAGGEISYTWTPATTLDDSTKAMPVATPAGTSTKYYVTISDSTCSAMDSVTIETDDINLHTGFNFQVCQDSPAVFNVTVDLDGVNFTWFPTTGLSCSNCEDPVATTDSAKTWYKVYASSGSCSDTDSVRVTTKAPPNTNAGADQVTCKGGTVNLSGSGGASFKWFPNIALSSDTDPTPTANPTETTKYVLRSTSSFGCSSTDSVLVVVNGFDYMGVFRQPDSLCLGDTGQLYAFVPCKNYYEDFPEYNFRPSTNATPVNLNSNQNTSAIPLGFDFDFYCTSYDSVFISSNGYIQFGDTNVASSAVQVIANTNDPNTIIAGAWQYYYPTLGGSISYETVGTAPNREFIVTWDSLDHNGGLWDMFNTFQVILYESSGEIDIMIKQLTATSFTTIGAENEDGDIAKAIVNRKVHTDTLAAYRLVPAPMNHTFTWSPGTHMNDSTIAAPKVQAQDGVFYAVHLQDGNCNRYDSLDFHVEDFQVTVTEDSVIMCQGDSADLEASATGPVKEWLWLPATTLTAPTSAATKAYPFGPTTYNVTAESHLGCEDASSVHVSIDSLPNAFFGYSISNLTITLTDSSTKATSWTWNFGDGKTDNQQNTNHTYTTSGSYLITLLAHNQCGTDTMRTTIDVIAEGIDGHATQTLFVAPNPSADGLFNIYSDSRDEATVSIFNVLGTKVNEINVSGQTRYTIDLSDQADGMYMIRYSSASEDRIAKIVKGATH